MSPDSTQKILIGVSSCLLGQEVRYDGGHKNNAYIVHTLGRFFEFVPFCPEFASGMGVPRAPVQLRIIDQETRCVRVDSHQIDVTEQLLDCAQEQNHWIKGLSGYIFKKDSPSCGMERVKVYKNEYPERIGTGVYAQYVMQHFPLMPLEEEGRLGDPVLRENFIQRVYVMHRWQQVIQESMTVDKLIVFHARHKLILMSHNQNYCRALGRLVATANDQKLHEIVDQYGLEMMQCLKQTATRGNHVNVLQHIQGYLKKQLAQGDKVELAETIENYRKGSMPLIVPITLLKHHFRHHPDPFIEKSYYMQPYPGELALQNEI